MSFGPYGPIFSQLKFIPIDSLQKKFVDKYKLVIWYPTNVKQFEMQ